MKRALVAMVAVCAFIAGAPVASAITDQDQRFVDYVKELKVPTSSDDDAIQIGRQICQALDAGQVEPAPTVRGMVSTLVGKGLEKGQAVQLIRAAVATYCPQYTAIVGR